MWWIRWKNISETDGGDLLVIVFSIHTRVGGQLCVSVIHGHQKLGRKEKKKVNYLSSSSSGCGRNSTILLSFYLFLFLPAKTDEWPRQHLSRSLIIFLFRGETHTHVGLLCVYQEIQHSLLTIIFQSHFRPLFHFLFQFFQFFFLHCQFQAVGFTFPDRAYCTNFKFPRHFPSHPELVTDIYVNQEKKRRSRKKWCKKWNWYTGEAQS